MIDNNNNINNDNDNTFFHNSSDQDGKTIEIGPLQLDKTSPDGKKFEYKIQHWARLVYCFTFYHNCK